MAACFVTGFDPGNVERNDDRLFRLYQFRTNNYMMFRDYAWEDGISDFFQNGSQNGANGSCALPQLFRIFNKMNVSLAPAFPQTLAEEAL